MNQANIVIAAFDWIVELIGTWRDSLDKPSPTLNQQCLTESDKRALANSRLRCIRTYDFLFFSFGDEPYCDEGKASVARLYEIFQAGQQAARDDIEMGMPDLRRWGAAHPDRFAPDEYSDFHETYARGYNSVTCRYLMAQKEIEEEQQTREDTMRVRAAMLLARQNTRTTMTIKREYK